MQFFSFDPNNPVFQIKDWTLSLQIITLENVYGLDPDGIRSSEHADTAALQCVGLRWGGGQQYAPGSVDVLARFEPDGMRVQIKAEAPEPIRAVKIMIRHLPPLTALDQLDAERAVPPEGLLDRYPNQLRLPIACVRTLDGETFGFRCEDAEHRAKRFAIYRERFAEDYTVECIHEEDARLFDTRISVPDWIFTRAADPAAFRADQLAFNERAAGLVRWEDRADVPEWARHLRLVVTLHGMHWSGYTFNTYAQMIDTLRYVAARIDGGQVLAYLPGWEGRYYWQYGDYRPEPLLGGESGFAALCHTARDLGIHLMPMFGANCVNAWRSNYHLFGPSSHMKTATRNVFHGNQPDWDTSRTQDTGWQAWLNPGAPAWQRELTRQIMRLLDQYDLHAVFLDTVEVWVNDPDFNMLEGYRQLVAELHQRRAHLLVTGEDWYDGLLPLFPIFQRTTKWRQTPDWVGRYARLMGHIADSEPSRGSTGVFESGYAPYERMPAQPHYLPTIAFVDGTLERSQHEIDSVIARARG
ncbi:MAG: hypothetical protein IAE80_22265 [Anaerolinea sp.]|nr:hypothetical protein [Anaerolinea sp.]